MCTYLIMDLMLLQSFYNQILMYTFTELSPGIM